MKNSDEGYFHVVCILPPQKLRNRKAGMALSVIELEKVLQIHSMARLNPLTEKKSI